MYLMMVNYHCILSTISTFTWLTPTSQVVASAVVEGPEKCHLHGGDPTGSVDLWPSMVT